MSDSRKGERETILVVDDNEAVRKLVVRILERADFEVLSADSGPNAMSVSEKVEGKIDLLLTDWDMPEMSGVALGQAMRAARPDLHIMMMSGGAQDSLMVLNHGWAYLQKPFVALRLVQMVNNVLRTPDRSQPAGDAFDTRLDADRTSIQAKDPDDHPADANESKDRESKPKSMSASAGAGIDFGEAGE